MRFTKTRYLQVNKPLQRYERPVVEVLVEVVAAKVTESIRKHYINAL